jgi:hypothetical protein
MVAWKRFPVPEFDYEPLRDLSAPPAKPIARSEADALAAKCKAGDLSVCGGYAVAPGAALLDRLKVKGDDAHAVMCLLPQKSVRLLGRSWAWRIQGAWVLDSLEAGSAKVLHHWKTMRPMNTRLGPDDGVTIKARICYVLTANRFADHWISNRSVIENAWSPGAGRKGFRILGGSDPELNDFHHTYLAFDWPA